MSLGTTTIETVEYDRLKAIEFQNDIFVNDTDNQVVFTIPIGYQGEDMQIRVYKGVEALKEFKDSICNTYDRRVEQLEVREVKQQKALESLRELLKEVNRISL